MSNKEDSLNENEEIDIFDDVDTEAEDMFADFENDTDNEEIMDDDFLNDDDDDDDKNFLSEDNDFFEEESSEYEEDIFSAEENNDIKEEENNDIKEEETETVEEQNIFSENNTIEADTMELEEEEKVEEILNKKPIKEEKIEENTENDVKEERIQDSDKNGNLKSIIASASIASLITVGGSFFAFSNMNIGGGIGETKEKFESISADMDILSNAVLEAQESTKNVNREVNNLSEKIEKVDSLEKDSKKIMHLMSALAIRTKDNTNSYNALNKKIDDLPNSTIQVAQKLIELEKKLSKLNNFEEYKNDLDGIKKAVRTQQNDISSLKKKVKTNVASIKKSNVAVKDLNEKALKNAQKITQNIKGIRNVNQKVMGESSVKDLLKKSQSSKDVRAVSLLFDNNKTVEINNQNIGYNIIGSIVSEIFYIEEEDGTVKSYQIGDRLEGYGIVRAIKDNKIIETDAGIVKNTNTDK